MTDPAAAIDERDVIARCLVTEIALLPRWRPVVRLRCDTENLQSRIRRMQEICIKAITTATLVILGTAVVPNASHSIEKKAVGGGMAGPKVTGTRPEVSGGVVGPTVGTQELTYSECKLLGGTVVADNNCPWVVHDRRPGAELTLPPVSIQF